MRDYYQSFGELEKQEREGEDWTRELVSRDPDILILAPHGGWIEPYTAEIARAVAGNDLSFYAFQGLKDGKNDRLHLTSHRFDEPLGLQAALSARWVLGIHGERSSPGEFVMVGGLWTRFREEVTGALDGAGINVVSPRPGLDGLNPANICNRGLSGAGGQLEISEGLRRRLRKKPDELFRFVESVRRGLLDACAKTDSGGPVEL